MLFTTVASVSAKFAYSSFAPAYDNAYPIVLLSNGLKTRLAEAQAVAKDIYQTVIKQSPAIAQIRQATKKGFRLVVDAGDDMLKAITEEFIHFLRVGSALLLWNNVSVPQFVYDAFHRL